jgi:hypothetical protein
MYNALPLPLSARAHTTLALLAASLLHYPLFVPVLGLDIVGHRLRLAVPVVVMVRVVWGTDILHLIHTTAFVAALEGAVARYL